MGFITIRENQLELFPSIQQANLGDTRVWFRFLPSKKPTSMIARGVIGTLRACDDHTYPATVKSYAAYRRRSVPEGPARCTHLV